MNKNSTHGSRSTADQPAAPHVRPIPYEEVRRVLEEIGKEAASGSGPKNDLQRAIG